MTSADQWLTLHNIQIRLCESMRSNPILTKLPWPIIFSPQTPNIFEFISVPYWSPLFGIHHLKLCRREKYPSLLDARVSRSRQQQKTHNEILYWHQIVLSCFMHLFVSFYCSMKHIITHPHTWSHRHTHDHTCKHRIIHTQSEGHTAIPDPRAMRQARCVILSSHC